MATQLSSRQQRFVQTVISGKTATAAYREAFGCTQKAAESGAPRLLGNARVSAAIAAANAEAAAAAQITKQYVVAGLLHEARHGDPKSRVAAWMGLAKVLGFITDKSEVVNVAYLIEVPARASSVKTWEAEAQRVTRSCRGDAGNGK